MLLQEFDPSYHAIIDPDIVHQKVDRFPETVVSVFSHQLFHALLTFLGGRQIAETHDVDGVWPIYEVNYKGHRFGFYKARLGAPACVGCFEDIWPMGMKRIILFGNCGVLDKDIKDCGIILPTAAIRDEGTSYHYAPAADEISVNEAYKEEFRKVCREFGYPVTEGITWTTDGFYRETRERVARRKAQGAVCVEMECAAMSAFAKFRGLEFFQFLYAGDNLDHSSWDPRSLSGTARLEDKEKIGLLAFELACRIEEQNLYLKEINEADWEEELAFLHAMPANTNGFENPCHDMDEDTFRNQEIPKRLRYARGEGLSPGHVPDTWFFLWAGSKIIGLYKIRHFCNEFLRGGSGHIGYGLLPEYRGKGIGTKGLAMALTKLRSMPDFEGGEAYLSCSEDNPASLKVMLKNGGYIHHTENGEHFVRIPKRPMNRIMIIGCPGAGKSTFARALREKTGLPIHYIDRMFWNADKTHVSQEELDDRIRKAASEDTWIIDGNYKRTLPLRLARADTVFLLDYPTQDCLEGVNARRGTVREDMPWVETEEDPEFNAYIREFASRQLPQIRALLADYPEINIITFRSRAEAENYLLWSDL